MNETDYNWTLAEQDLQADPWGASCPSCNLARSLVDRQGDVAYCSVHRCSGRVRSGHHAGERCRHHVSGENPAYCDKHGCVADWLADNGSARVRCANEGSMRDLPDGRRVRICDQHHQMMAQQHEAGQGGEAA